MELPSQSASNCRLAGSTSRFLSAALVDLLEVVRYARVGVCPGHLIVRNADETISVPKVVKGRKIRVISTGCLRQGSHMASTTNSVSKVRRHISGFLSGCMKWLGLRHRLGQLASLK